MVTSGNADHGMMNMSVGGFADRRTVPRGIYIYIIISTYELDDMYLPPVFRTRAGGSETFGLVRVVFENFFAQDDSVVVLVGEHRGCVCIHIRLLFEVPIWGLRAETLALAHWGRYFVLFFVHIQGACFKRGARAFQRANSDLRAPSTPNMAPITAREVPATGGMLRQHAAR